MPRFTVRACTVLAVALVAPLAFAQPGPAPGPPPAAQPVPPPAPPPGQPTAGQPPPGQPAPGQPPPGDTTAEPEPTREPVELFVLAGLGNAVCDNEKPDSDCPVDGAGAFALGGGWRFHDHWAVGLELAVWSFKVRDEWQGQLQDKATDVKFSSFYLSPFARWYWFEPGNFNPYLQAGIGFGAVRGEASNDNGSYSVAAKGMTYSLGIGMEWQLSKVFRLGPQFLAYLHVSSEICEETNGDETCRKPTENENGEREGLALPWRLVAVGTFTFGS